MKLKSLEIELETWGENKGKYKGRLRYADKRETELEIHLTPEQAEGFLAFSAPILLAAAESANEQFKNQIRDLVPKNAEPQPA